MEPIIQFYNTEDGNIVPKVRICLKYKTLFVEIGLKILYFCNLCHLRSVIKMEIIP